MRKNPVKKKVEKSSPKKTSKRLKKQTVRVLKHSGIEMMNFEVPSRDNLLDRGYEHARKDG